MLSWLRWPWGGKSNAEKADELRDVRRQTDQKLKREEAKKHQGDAGEIRPTSEFGSAQSSNQPKAPEDGSQARSGMAQDVRAKAGEVHLAGACRPPTPKR
jgi:hypothetical protein